MHGVPNLLLVRVEVGVSISSLRTTDWDEFRRPVGGAGDFRIAMAKQSGVDRGGRSRSQVVQSRSVAGSTGHPPIPRDGRFTPGVRR